MTPPGLVSVQTAQDAVPASETRRIGRGRLFRKYLLLIITLVSGALLTSGGISLYFTYQETESALADLQHEKALAAASRIEQYVRTIEQQLRVRGACRSSTRQTWSCAESSSSSSCARHRR